MPNFLQNLDQTILLYLQDTIRQDWLTPLMQTITRLGNAGFLPILATLLLLLLPQTRKIGIASTFSLALCFLLTNMILKPTIARIRPYEVIQSLTLLIPPPHDYSFPSGHTSSAFAVAPLLFLTHRKSIAIPALLLAALIAFSRLYLAVHYPTDVLAGFLIGILCAFLSYRFLYRPLTTHSK